MTLQTKPSKNRRRKNQRAAYHSAVNTLSKDPQNREAIETLEALLSRYCGQVDLQIDSIGACSEEMCRKDEHRFINDLIRQLESNGWVTIQTPHGNVQIKTDINDYIQQRRSAGTRHGQIHSMVAESLHERAIQRIRPRHN